MPLAIFKTCQQLFWSEVFAPRPISSNEYGTYSNRTARNELPVVLAYALGCHSRVGWRISSGLFHWIVFPLSPCTAVVDVDSGVRLLADGQCEHQRNRTQLHSQSVLPAQDLESHFRSRTVDRLLLLADDV